MSIRSYYYSQKLFYIFDPPIILSKIDTRMKTYVGKIGQKPLADPKFQKNPFMRNIKTGGNPSKYLNPNVRISNQKTPVKVEVVVEKVEDPNDLSMDAYLLSDASKELYKFLAKSA